MTVCSLFGDCDTPESMWENIETALTILITDCNVDFFYIGNVGKFDEMAETILHSLCKKYPHVGYNVILCVDSGVTFSPLEIYEKYLCPIFAFKDSSKEKIEDKIRYWMAGEADYVLLYTKDSDSKVSEIRRYARRKNKIIIPLCCE